VHNAEASKPCKRHELLVASSIDAIIALVQLQATNRLRPSQFGCSVQHVPPPPPFIHFRHPIFGFGIHHLPRTPTTHLQHPPLDSVTLHSPRVPTTRLQHPPLDYGTHHLTMAPTTQLQHPPLASDSPLPTTTHLRCPLFTLDAHHSTLSSPFKSANHHLTPVTTTQLQRTSLASGSSTLAHTSQYPAQHYAQTNNHFALLCSSSPSITCG